MGHSWVVGQGSLHLHESDDVTIPFFGRQDTFRFVDFGQTVG